MEELVANFTLSEPEEIKAIFKIDLTPSKVSQLENDLGFVTKDEVVTPDIDLSDYALKSDIPDVSVFALKSDINNALGEIETLLKEV